jgi:hypothetical protein
MLFATDSASGFKDVIALIVGLNASSIRDRYTDTTLRHVVRPVKREL